MRHPVWPFCLSHTILWLTVCLLAGSVPSAEAAIKVAPTAVELNIPEGSQQLLVTDLANNASRDVTRDVKFEVTPPTLATIDERGLVRPLANGKGTIAVSLGSERMTIPLEVRGFQSPPRVSFHNEIIPILTKARCNSGGCHGKAEGQNGFRLSIFGYDPESDFAALVREGRGRRISPATPDKSLFFLKGSARMPHGGGRKIEPGSYRDELLLRWISEGAELDSVENQTGRITAIEIDPPQQIVTAGGMQQIRVTAVDAAGNRRCVTTEAEFESNVPTIADVDPLGLVQATDVPGEAAILIRYLGQVATCRISLPRPGVTFPRPPENNFVDRLVWDQLQRLGIQPSGPADDATFLRRVYIDTIGTLPTAAEARTFLEDKAADKRAKLIDQLLERPEYADYWSMRWLAILKADQLMVTPQGTVAMQRWLHRQFKDNIPYDQFVREIVTVQGNTSAEGPGAFYKASPKPDEAARAISQLLLGVRIECAQCHHHPSERWGQDDYVGLAGFFTGMTLKNLPNGEQALVSRGGTDLPHPRTGVIVPARALGAPTADFSKVTDRRQVFADWLTSRDNAFLSKAIANRLWAHYFGRGLVEPIDDMRATNPSANEPLMLALADHLRDSKFDLKAFTRTLLNSQVYQLSIDTNPSNKADTQNFSHAYYKTLPAEVLLDAISQTTGVPEKFNGFPDGYRAIQVWDNRLPSYFFTIFGRPVRATVCECERSDEPSIAQALHLLNAPEIGDKISHRHGKARELAASTLTPPQIIDEIYLATLARFPTETERGLMLEAFTSSDRRAGAEDVLWAVMNSKEFVFNH